MDAVVCMDGNQRSCLVVGSGAAGVEFVSMGGAGLVFNTLLEPQFKEEWKPAEYDLSRACSRYLDYAAKHTGNNQEAVDRVRALDTKLTVAAGDLMAAELAAPVVEVAAESAGVGYVAPVAEVVAAPVVAAVAEIIAPVAEVVAPVVEVPVVTPVAEEVPLVQVPSKKEEKLMSDLNESPVVAAPVATVAEVVAAPVVAAVTPVAVAEVVAAAAPVAEVALPAVAQKPALSPVDGDDEGPGYAVHVNGQSVTVEMNKPRERRVDHDAYASRDQVVINTAKEPSFYVGLDADGVLARISSYTDEDRKVVGVQAGAWIADGFKVNTVNLKDLAKLVAAARKVYEPKKVAGAEPAGPAE